MVVVAWCSQYGFYFLKYYWNHLCDNLWLFWLLYFQYLSQNSLVLLVTSEKCITFTTTILVISKQYITFPKMSFTLININLFSSFLHFRFGAVSEGLVSDSNNVFLWLNQTIFTKKGYFQNFSGFQFYVHKLCTIMCIRIAPQTAVFYQFSSTRLCAKNCFHFTLKSFLF